MDPVGVLAECWSLVQELVEGYIWQYELVNTAILFSEEVDPVGVLAECWSLVQELVEGYIWQYQPFALRLDTSKGTVVPTLQIRLIFV